MFNNLSDKLDKALHTLKGHGKITEVNVAETLKEVRRALLDADVNFKIAKEFTKRVQTQALGQDVLTTLNPGQLMIKLVKDELTLLMGGETVGVHLGGSPTIILMSGLQGSGKTTFSGKLANFLKTKKSKEVLLVGCDVYRPAAINQLQVVGEQIGVEVYAEIGNNNPVEISKNAIKHDDEISKSTYLIDRDTYVLNGSRTEMEVKSQDTDTHYMVIIDDKIKTMQFVYEDGEKRLQTAIFTYGQ